MTIGAIIMLVFGAVLLWGGLGLTIAIAIKKNKD
jgi:hypothetical protein